MAPEVHAEALYIGDGEGTEVTATAAELNDLADGVPALGWQVVRARHAVAAITAGTAVVLANVAGYSFVVKDAWMRAIGGNLSGPTTVEIAEETSGDVFLSHVTADMTENVWRGCGTGDGTNVITNITAGGLVVANKKLLLTDTGGSGAATATHIDTIVAGFWTTA
jgi:hypothetical protein